MSGLTVVRIANRAMGKRQNHLSGSSDPRAMSDSFNLRWKRSTIPLASGWYGVVMMTLIPHVLVNCWKMADEN